MAALTSFTSRACALPARPAKSAVLPCAIPPCAQPTSLLLPAAPSPARPSLPVRTHRRRQVCRAAAEEVDVQSDVSADAEWVPVCRPEELPKGVRKEVEVAGAQVLMFWYRNQIYCIQARSPAEGAYSEGFIKAKFTQDFCIECPSTGSLFSLKDGSIVAWYPGNPVLAALTPKDTCPPMEIYPVKLAQDAIYVDVSGARSARRVGPSKGGADTSIDNNNVFSVQPNAYFEGMSPEERATLYMDGAKAANAPNPAVAIATTAGVALFSVVGTAICIYLENLTLLGVFWAILGGVAAYASYRYINRDSTSQ